MTEPVRIPVLDVNVYFFYDRDTAIQFIKDNSSSEDEWKVLEKSMGVCYELDAKDGYTYRMMCVFDGERNTAIHEAVHMAWFIIHHCGMRVARDNHEILAYLTAWIADRAISGQTQKPPI